MTALLALAWRWLILIVGGIALSGCAPSPPPDLAAPTATEAPFYAPDFTLMTSDGEPVTLSDQRGRWVMLNFWATWCVPCVAEMPILQTLADERADQIALFGINVREDRSQVTDFIAAHNLTFPILLNPPDSVLSDYLVMGLPQTLVIDPNGEILWRQFGPLDLSAFGELLDSLIASRRSNP